MSINNNYENTKNLEQNYGGGAVPIYIFVGQARIYGKILLNISKNVIPFFFSFPRKNTEVLFPTFPSTELTEFQYIF